MKITPRMRNVRWLYDIWMDKSVPLEIVFSKTEFLENAWYLRKNIVLCVTTIASFLAHDFLHKVGKVSFFVLLGTMKTRLIWKKNPWRLESNDFQTCQNKSNIRFSHFGHEMNVDRWHWKNVSFEKRSMAAKISPDPSRF